MSFILSMKQFTRGNTIDEVTPQMTKVTAGTSS
jgi:hypothetical protein